MNNLAHEIKNLIINTLNLEDISVDDIDSDAPLFIEGLRLDSIDALELGIALQKKYGIRFKSSDDNIKEHFFSVTSIANFICKQIEVGNND